MQKHWATMSSPMKFLAQITNDVNSIRKGVKSVRQDCPIGMYEVGCNFEFDVPDYFWKCLLEN